LTPFCFSSNFFSILKKLWAVCAMVKHGGHTSTGEGVRD
jgi:hypothetical protein